jgi:outer membrane lipoprotein carrier protein
MRPSMRLPIVVGLAILLRIAAPVAQTPPSARELAAKIQAHYDAVRDFTADFALTQTSALRPRPRVEHGHVLVKKPLRMRWTYATSEKNEFVADGTMLYGSYPEDRYVDVSALPDEDDGTATWILFLAGRGNLTRDFEASLPADQPAGEWRLDLAPLPGRQADFESLTLEVDRGSLRMTGLEVRDDQGGTSDYRFSNLRENQGLSDRQFEFTIPDGFEVNWLR